VAAGLTDSAERALTTLSGTVADDDVRYGRDVAVGGLEDAIARGARAEGGAGGARST